MARTTSLQLSTFIGIDQEDCSQLITPDSIQIASHFSARKGRAINEDAGLMVCYGSVYQILAIADGLGGHDDGAIASRLAIEELAHRFRTPITGKKRREVILDAFEAANHKILGLETGAATTLVVVEISQGGVRMFFAGDSVALIIGVSGEMRFRTIGHTPVDLGIEAGLLSEGAYDPKGSRHLVTNSLGSPELRIEMACPHILVPGDTLLVASDGLTDNLSLTEICEHTRLKDSVSICQALVSHAHERMQSNLEQFSKPDDLSIFVYKSIT